MVNDTVQAHVRTARQAATELRKNRAGQIKKTSNDVFRDSWKTKTKHTWNVFNSQMEVTSTGRCFLRLSPGDKGGVQKEKDTGGCMRASELNMSSRKTGLTTIQHNRQLATTGEFSTTIFD